MEEIGTSFLKIKKRNGLLESFDALKITKAIAKAGKASGEFNDDVAKTLTMRSLNLAMQISSDKEPSVEFIQDCVEDVLLTSPYKKTARAYIIYREQHARIRDMASKFNLDMVDQYLKKEDWQVKENSNMSFSLQGLNNYLSSEISKAYWLNNIYPEDVKAVHQQGDMHIHDLGLLSVYCVGWDLQDLLTEGFKGASGKIESKPAKHLRTALGQMVNFFYTLQGESAGAQAFSNFDSLLAPFIRYDELTYLEVKQALQEFVFNVNVPTRVGFQSPFTNVTLDLNVPSYLKDQPVIIGGKMMDAVYGDFQNEMDIFNKAFLEVLLEGDAKGRVFSFPIPTINITKDFDWDNENLDTLWEVTGKYGIPYFSNFVNSDMDPEDARSMCCRLRIDNRNLEKRGGGLFGANPLTGSIGVVTLNMARIGHISSNVDEFKSRVIELMELAKDSLEIKRKILENFTENNLYPYLKFYLRNIKKKTGEYLTNHFSTIGLVGMNEACINLFGKDIGTEEGKEFSLSILDFMRDKLTEYQLETGNNYNLEATPAEGTSYRLANLDKKYYPDIICANECDCQGEEAQPFYTNSTHLPVNYTDDIFELLDLQDDLQSKYTGGTVSHIFLGEQISNFAMVKKLVKKICSNYHLPYFTLSPTFSVCPSHGYINGEEHKCPTCAAECEVYSRIVGYLRPVKQWNVGKKQEFKTRKTFGDKLCI